METSPYEQIQALSGLTAAQLREKYLDVFGEERRARNRLFLQKRIAWRLQALAEGGLSERARRRAEALANEADLRQRAPRDPVTPGSAEVRARTTKGPIPLSQDPRLLLPGTLLVQEFRGRHIVVKVLDEGFEFEDRHYPSLSAIAKDITGSKWNGFLFFGLTGWSAREPAHARGGGRVNGSLHPHRTQTAPASARNGTVRCAIYTRKSTDEGLDQEFNSLDAQRESAEAYIASQRSEGWTCLPDRYDDGFTGGNMQRPALERLCADIEAGQIDCVVVYKMDRLSRSLLDFARMMELFEREIISECIKDKVSAARRRGKWVGGRNLRSAGLGPGFVAGIGSSRTQRPPLREGYE